MVVADGVGVAPPGPSNAVHLAHTPTLDALTSSRLSTELRATGTAVGLPSDDDMGNSEVGHNAIGAGRIFAQGAKLVNQAIDGGSLFEGEVWTETIDRCRDGGTLHLIGLHSDGNVHAHTDHLYALLRRAAGEGVARARLHVLLDGRDVPARSALDYLGETETVLAEINDAHGVDYRIASGGGRMTITMDRYEADWEMVKRGYDCHTWGVGRPFASAVEAVETLYGESDAGDQYLDCFVIVDDDGSRWARWPTVTPSSSPTSGAIGPSRSPGPTRRPTSPRSIGRRPTVDPTPDVSFAGMLQYDGDALIPKRYWLRPRPSTGRWASICARRGCPASP